MYFYFDNATFDGEEKLQRKRLNEWDCHADQHWIHGWGWGLFLGKKNKKERSMLAMEPILIETTHRAWVAKASNLIGPF